MNRMMVQFEEKNENGKRFLHIILTDEGRTELEDHGDELDGDDLMYEMFEYQTCNGWGWIQPEQIGAMTSAPILSNVGVQDDHGNLIGCTDVYAYMDYAVRSPIRELKEKGYVDFIHSGVEFAARFTVLTLDDELVKSDQTGTQLHDDYDEYHWDTQIGDLEVGDTTKIHPISRIRTGTVTDLIVRRDA